MNCRHVEPLLTDHLDGLLAEPEAVAVAGHLDACPACRRRQEEFRALRAELRGLADLLPPPHMARRALDRWSREQGAGGRGSGARKGWRGSFLPPLFVSLPSPVFSPRAVGAALAASALTAALGLALVQHRAGIHGNLARIVKQPGMPGRKPSDDLPRKRESHEFSGVRHRLDREQTGPEALPKLATSTGVAGPPVGAIGPIGPVPPIWSPSHAREVRNHVLIAPARAQGDLDYLNQDAMCILSQWLPLKRDEWAELEDRVRRYVHVKDDFVQIPFPRVAGTGDRAVVAAVEQYKREAAIIDARLAREVTVQFKGAALSDLCDRMRADSGIQLSAGPSVADEKVTLLCEKQPLREVMRELSRPFGYTWLRSGEPGKYRYELVQDLRSQLLEEELRNQDRIQALIALQREMDRYRPYLHLSPDEALAREKSASPADKKLLHHLANKGWGPVQIYFRLTRSEMEALRNGQRLVFSQEPEAGQRPLPADVARGVLQAWRGPRIVKQEDGFGYADADDPNGRPLTAVPEVHAWLFLEMRPSEGGKLMLDGVSGWFTPRNLPRRAWAYDPDDLNGLASASNSTARAPESEVLNARSADDPALRGRVTLQPVCSYPGAGRQADVSSIPTPESTAERSTGSSAPEKKVASADVLEALHQATHLPIVADAYTRLYPLGAVSVRNGGLFATLNRVSDAMRLRWKKDGAWLQFRSTTFYQDRLKEVPSRLLSRWAASRRNRGSLSLDDLCEIAQLTEEQLAAADMAEGAQYCWGLTEWVLFRNPWRRPVWRFLGEFTPAQRQKMINGTGLPFTEMSLSQQQRFLSFASIARLDEPGSPLQSPADLEGAALRVKYTVPGWFEWRPAGPEWLQWVRLLGPGRKGRREFRPLVIERTREAALAAARQQFPALREAALRWVRQEDPKFDEAQLVLQQSQIIPTELFLAVVQMPGASNQRHLLLVSSHGMGYFSTW